MLLGSDCYHTDLPIPQYRCQYEQCNTTRADPFSDVWNEIECWLKDEPQLGSTELLLKLEDEHPGQFNEGHRRTLQRRLQEWRVKVVRELVYGTRADGNILAEAKK